jgi:hypothetical protein
MLDANGALEKDTDLLNLLARCDLHDLHRHHPAHSTYIGSANRRIDFIFGCDNVEQNVTRSGILPYNKGPQADHRGLYVDLTLPKMFITPSSL